jgi:hypothetical protein
MYLFMSYETTFLGLILVDILCMSTVANLCVFACEWLERSLPWRFYGIFHKNMDANHYVGIDVLSDLPFGRTFYYKGHTHKASSQCESAGVSPDCSLDRMSPGTRHMSTVSPLYEQTDVFLYCFSLWTSSCTHHNDNMGDHHYVCVGVLRDYFYHCNPFYPMYKCMGALP